MCIISFAIRYMIIISTNTRVITPHCGVFFWLSFRKGRAGKIEAQSEAHSRQYALFSCGSIFELAFSSQFILLEQSFS